MDTEKTTFDFPQIGVVKSCYKAKFGIPRQPGLIDEAKGTIRILPPFNQPNIVRGLEQFSHIWVVWVFHEALRDGWKATVRPPRLGGDTRIGVFATRSPFRPSPIGLSVMKLESVEIGGQGKILLHVSGLDLVDGTPVLDIKPYLPYTDSIPSAIGGFAHNAPESEALQVIVSPEADAVFEKLASHGWKHLRTLAMKVIAGDPRPAYQREIGREYSVFLEESEIFWKIQSDGVAVITRVAKAGHE